MRYPVFFLLLAAACNRPAPAVTSESFGTLPDGTPVTRFILKNASGTEVHLSDFGATLLRVRMPDRNGVLTDVTLGYATLEEYRNDFASMGGIVGRYANRIANATFSLDGQEIRVSKNDPPNHIHGGFTGFNRVMWTADSVFSKPAPGVSFVRVSPDGEEGFPGDLTVRVTVRLLAGTTVRYDYSAETTAPTVVNLTAHPYFNLSGSADSSVANHELRIAAAAYLPVNAFLIPSATAPVDGLPFDLRTATRLQKVFDAQHPQLTTARGLDHTFVPDGSGFRFMAELVHTASGRTLSVWSDQPGLQAYTGNFLDGSMTNRDGRPMPFRHGICLETQHYPDSPNRPEFPAVVLRPSELFRSATEYRFGMR